MCQILCRIHRQKNHASGKSEKEDRTVYDCQGSHRGGRYSILQDSAFQSDFQIARRRWLRNIHYQIMVMDFSGLCCSDFYIILFGTLGYCFVRALYWHNTMSWQYYNMGVLCYCNIMLLGYYVAMLLCYCNIMFLGYYVVMLLCYCNVMLLGYYVVILLCYYNVMLSGYYVVVLLCYCNVMLLWHHVIVLLCYQGITLLQYHNRAYFTYALIINILQSSLSSAYNFTITIYILLYDTDWYVISVNQDAIVQYSIKLSILNI